jgi:hypothetical protein
LAYLFEEADHIPEELLRSVGIDQKLLKEKEQNLVNAFKMFRQEKNTIKSIKYKTEIIKACKEDWDVLCKVVKVLVLSEETPK